MGARLVAVNENGRRIGEDHQNAVLTDHEVDLLLKLRGQGLGYGALAALFEIGKTTARDICIGRRRAQYPAAFRAVRA